MPEFKEPTREPIRNNSFKKLFDACLASGADPVEYAKENGFDLNNGEFFNELREWSAATVGNRNPKEDLLLYKIAENSNACCHIDCGGPTCSRNMFDKILEQPHLLVTEKIDLLNEAIKSKSVFDFSKPRIIQNLLKELFSSDLSPENINQISALLILTKKLATENSNNQNPYVLRDFKTLEDTVDKYEKILGKN